MIQGSDSFRLVVRRGPQPNQTYDLNKDIVTLGRDITNDIVINDPEVSRHHMRMTRGAGGYTIEDLGSTNGTFINMQRLSGARPMRPGDMIGLGETVTLAYEALAAPGVGAQMEEAGGTIPSAPRGAAVYSPQPVQQQPYASPSPTAYSPAPAPAQQQPVTPGYGSDYDPYAAREEEPRSTTRWVLIGCGGLALFCCCSSVIGALAVDQLCLWSRIPLVYDIIRALGYTQIC
jgi:predicted component of type VI protein secretion system